MSLFLSEDASAIKISVAFKLNEGKCSLKKTEMFQEGLEQMVPGMNIKMRVSRLQSYRYFPNMKYTRSKA